MTILEFILCQLTTFFFADRNQRRYRATKIGNSRKIKIHITQRHLHLKRANSQHSHLHKLILYLKTGPAIDKIDQTRHQLKMVFEMRPSTVRIFRLAYIDLIFFFLRKNFHIIDTCLYIFLQNLIASRLLYQAFSVYGCESLNY